MTPFTMHMPKSRIGQITRAKDIVGALQKIGISSDSLLVSLTIPVLINHLKAGITADPNLERSISADDFYFHAQRVADNDKVAIGIEREDILQALAYNIFTDPRYAPIFDAAGLNNFREDVTRHYRALNHS